MEGPQGFARLIEEMLELFTTRREFRRQMLFNMPLIVGPARQHQIRRSLAVGLADLIPRKLYPSPKEKTVAAQMIVHTFMGAVVVFLDPNLSEDERVLFQSEVKKLIFRYVGLAN